MTSGDLYFFFDAKYYTNYHDNNECRPMNSRGGKMVGTHHNKNPTAFTASTDEEKKMAMSKLYCFEYKNRGTCARGENCWYIHATEGKYVRTYVQYGCTCTFIYRVSCISLFYFLLKCFLHCNMIDNFFTEDAFGS